MIPREPTHRIARAILESFNFGVDVQDPNAYTGKLKVLDLDTKRRHTIALCRARHLPETLELIRELAECVHPQEPGRKPPPEVSLEVAEEFDRSLRLVGFERRQP